MRSNKFLISSLLAAALHCYTHKCCFVRSEDVSIDPVDVTRDAYYGYPAYNDPESNKATEANPAYEGSNSSASTQTEVDNRSRLSGNNRNKNYNKTVTTANYAVDAPANGKHTDPKVFRVKKTVELLIDAPPRGSKRLYKDVKSYGKSRKDAKSLKNNEYNRSAEVDNLSYGEDGKADNERFPNMSNENVASTTDNSIAAALEGATDGTDSLNRNEDINRALPRSRRGSSRARRNIRYGGRRYRRRRNSRMNGNRRYNNFASSYRKAKRGRNSDMADSGKYPVPATEDAAIAVEEPAIANEGGLDSERNYDARRSGEAVKEMDNDELIDEYLDTEDRPEDDRVAYSDGLSQASTLDRIAEYNLLRNDSPNEEERDNDDERPAPSLLEDGATVDDGGAANNSTAFENGDNGGSNENLDNVEKGDKVDSVENLDNVEKGDNVENADNWGSTVSSDNVEKTASVDSSENVYERPAPSLLEDGATVDDGGAANNSTAVENSDNGGNNENLDNAEKVERSDETLDQSSTPEGGENTSVDSGSNAVEASEVEEVSEGTKPRNLRSKKSKKNKKGSAKGKKSKGKPSKRVAKRKAKKEAKKEAQKEAKKLAKREAKQEARKAKKKEIARTKKADKKAEKRAMKEAKKAKKEAGKGLKKDKPVKNDNKEKLSKSSERDVEDASMIASGVAPSGSDSTGSYSVNGGNNDKDGDSETGMLEKEEDGDDEANSAPTLLSYKRISTDFDMPQNDRVGPRDSKTGTDERQNASLDDANGLDNGPSERNNASYGTKTDGLSISANEEPITEVIEEDDAGSDYEENYPSNETEEDENGVETTRL